MNTNRRHRPAFAMAASSAVLLAALAAACSTPDDPLEPGPGLRPLTTVAARGVQIYECRAGDAGAPAAWAFVAPRAELHDAQGRLLGQHGAGPHWTAADGSRVEGTVAARREAPAAGAIPWLLLRTRSTGGTGAWSAVAAIQRIHTAGGLAPGHGCDAQHIGQQVQVPYRADYRLFVAV